VIVVHSVPDIPVSAVAQCVAKRQTLFLKIIENIFNQIMGVCDSKSKSQSVQEVVSKNTLIYKN
jgi:hypothetical protein